MKQIWLGAGLLSAALWSCGNFAGFNGDWDRVKEDFHYSYPLQPGGHLDLDNRNGAVEIAGWDRNSIDVSGTKYASSEDYLKQIQVNVQANGNDATVSTEFPSGWSHGSYGVKYYIHVPRQIQLRRAQTTNGSISIEDLQGGGEVGSTNGRVGMERDTGNYDVRTTNGVIELEEDAGSFQVATSNGAIRGRIKEGAAEAHTTNGPIELTILKPEAGRAIRVSTTNGGITLALAEFHDNSLTAETTNGSVTLRLPSGTNARVNAETSVSGVTTDFPLTVTGEISKHRLSGQIGSGGPLISANTSTGSIRLERY